MSDQLISSLMTIALAIVGIAILAVLVSKNADTAGVISAAGTAFGQDLRAAEAPITGGSLGITGGLAPQD